MTFIPTIQDKSAFRTTDNLPGTTLTNSITDSQTGNISVGDTSNFNPTGYIYIDSEFLEYDQIVNSTTLNIINRGIFTTSPSSHNASSVVGAAYSSGVLKLDGYTQVTTKILCSNTGRMRFQWFTDPNGSNVIRTLAPPYSTTNKYDFLSAPNFGPYVRYVFANTEANITNNFYFETEFYTKSISPQVLTLDSTIVTGMTSTLNRSVITGATRNNQFSNVGVTNNIDPFLKVSIQDPLSSFGQVLVADETPHIQLSFIYGVNPNLTSLDALNGSATASNSLLNVSSSANTNSYCKMYSKRYIRYKIGQGCKARFTCVFDNPVVGNNQLIGVGDDVNGFFFGYNGVNFGVLRRSNSIDHWIYQNSWNYDKLDGTGSSQMTLNHQLGNVYSISYQWLGFGSITFSIEDFSTGILIPVHRIQYANSYASPSILQPTLPLRVSSENTTNNTNIVVKSSSLAGFSEGSNIVLGTTYSASSSDVLSVTTEVPVLSIRVNTQINSIDAYVRVLLDEMTAVGEGTGSNIIKFNLYKNPTTLSTPSWVDTDSSNSVVSTDTASTSFTGGLRIGSYVVERNRGLQVNLREKQITMFRGDILTITASSNSNCDPDIALVWTEENTG